MELGILSFGERLPDPHTGRLQTERERLDGLVALVRQADAAGLDVVALGEHHRPDFTLSAPEIVLAALASATSRIRLATGVTVLSTQDPVRVFQQFATLDQLSGGRAELVVGRGAFTESFPLFGYDLADYDELFEEKLRLLLRLREEERVTWSGRLRSPLHDVELSPRPVQDPLPVWIGAGGTPSSIVRAGVLGLPLSLGFFTGPGQFVPRVELYRRAAAEAGQDQARLRVATGGHTFVGRTSQGARDAFYPYYSSYWRGIRGSSEADGFPRDVFDGWIDGGMPVGSPQQVVDAILSHRELLGADRFIAQLDVGSLPPSMAGENLELFATEVVPVIRRETAAAVGPAG